MSIQVFCPFIWWVTYFLAVQLIYLYINWSNVWFVDILYHSVGCLFTLLILSFAVQKSFSLMKYHLCTFVACIFRAISPQKHLLDQCLITFPLSFPNTLMVSGLTFKSSTHFELIFIDGVNQGPVSFCWWKPVVTVQFSHSVVSDSLWSHGLQHARLPCPSPTPGPYSDSCPLSQWCHPTILPSVIPFSSCLQSFPVSGCFPMSWFFASGGQRIGISASASASVLPMNIHDWVPLGWTGWISLQSKGLSRVFSNTTVQKHQFFIAQLSWLSNSHIHTWLLEKS